MIFLDNYLVTNNGIPSPPVPKVISAISLSSTKVKVIFDIPMTNNIEFRTTTNYTFTGVGAAVNAILITPEAIPFPTFVEIDLDNETTGGTLYTVTVDHTTGIISSGGSPLSSVFRAASFVSLAIDPTVVAASSLSPTSVRVVFSEDMDINAAILTSTNYTISGGLSVTGVLGTGPGFVDLGTSVQPFGPAFTITVALSVGIQDDSLNSLTTPNTAVFIGNSASPQPAIGIVTPTISSLTVPFTEPMLNNSSLNDPDNYTITAGVGGVSLGIANIIPEAVAFPTFVTLLIGEQTIGITYNIEVNNVISSLGAPIDTAFNDDDWLGVGALPTLLAAVPSDTRTIRLTFSEPMRLASGFNNPLSYTLNGGLTVQSIILPPVSQPFFLDIFVNQEMVGGFPYIVTTSLGLQDLSRNLIDPFGNTAAFTGIAILPFPALAEFIDLDTIEIKFNEELTNDAALVDISNYTLDNGGVVISATRIDGRTIRLLTSSTFFNTQYNLTVSSALTDLGGNSIDPLKDTLPVTKFQLGVVGAIEVKENLPLNTLDAYNDGYAGEVCDFSNGVVSLQVGGSSPDSYSIFEGYSPEDGYTIEGYSCVGVPFDIDCGLYEFDYDTFLNTNFSEFPNRIFIGSDFNKENNANAIIDDFRISNDLLLDTRPGESLPSGQSSITVNANRTVAFKDFLTSLTTTLVLIDFNGGIFNLAPFIQFFTQGFFIATGSVNANFKTALRFITTKAFVKENTGIFNPNEGAIEFWIRPLIDLSTDNTRRVYVDLKSATSLNRMTIFKDELGRLTWEIIDDNGISFKVSCAIDWRKCQWHHVGVSWDFNSEFINDDSMRMVIDNQEVSGASFGSIFPSSGVPLKYGAGLKYGDCAQDIGSERGIIDETIRFTAGKSSPDGLDVPRIVFGSNEDGAAEPGQILAMADMDNIRISDVVRSVADLILAFGSGPNSSTTLPVIEDNFTTSLDDFDEDATVQEGGAILIDRVSGVFDFEVEVIDSFNKVISDEECTQLIEDLLNVIKPAHTRVNVTFKN